MEYSRIALLIITYQLKLSSTYRVGIFSILKLYNDNTIWKAPVFWWCLCRAHWTDGHLQLSPHSGHCILTGPGCAGNIVGNWIGAYSVVPCTPYFVFCYSIGCAGMRWSGYVYIYIYISSSLHTRRSANRGTPCMLYNGVQRKNWIED